MDGPKKTNTRGRSVRVDYLSSQIDAVHFGHKQGRVRSSRGLRPRSIKIAYFLNKVPATNNCIAIARGIRAPIQTPKLVVKLSGPMMVPTSAKVGIAGFIHENPADRKIARGFCFDHSETISCIVRLQTEPVRPLIDLEFTRREISTPIPEASQKVKNETSFVRSKTCAT